MGCGSDAKTKKNPAIAKRLDITVSDHKRNAAPGKEKSEGLDFDALKKLSTKSSLMLAGQKS